MTKESWFNTNWQRKRELDSCISESDWLSVLEDMKCEDAGSGGLVTFVNPFSYLQVLDASFDIGRFKWFVDGQLLRVLHRMIFRFDPRRHSFDFTSVASDVFSLCEERRLRLAIVAASPGEPQRAVENIQKKFPQLNVVYFRDGYFSNDSDLESCFDDLKGEKIDVLICGMGTPLQEEFLLKVDERNVARWAFTCGGFISQTAEAVHYYPKFVMKYGFRGLYRIYRHDYVRRRYLYDYPRFLSLYLIGLFKQAA